MKITGLLFGKIDEEFKIFQAATKNGLADSMPETDNEKIIGLYEEAILKDSVTKLIKRYPVFLKAQIKNQEAISNSLELSFAHFFAYLNSAHEVYENIRKYLNKNSLQDGHRLILPLYGKLIRLSEEIGVMLLNGYPDGAWRIWRSLYEDTAVLLLLIKERDKDDLSSRYIDHIYRSKRKRVDSMQTYHESLKFPPVDTELLLGLNKRHEEIKNKYGKIFLADDYGWASTVFNFTRKVTLRDIEEFVGLKRFRPFYIWASEYSHPTFGSLYDFFQDGKLNLNAVIRQSTKSKSYIDPMQFTISLFHEVNLVFLKIYSVESEFEINVLLFRRIFEGLIKSFD